MLLLVLSSCILDWMLFLGVVIGLPFGVVIGVANGFAFGGFF